MNYFYHYYFLCLQVNEALKVCQQELICLCTCEQSSYRIKFDWESEQTNIQIYVYI